MVWIVGCLGFLSFLRNTKCGICFSLSFLCLGILTLYIVVSPFYVFHTVQAVVFDLGLKIFKMAPRSLA